MCAIKGMKWKIVNNERAGELHIEPVETGTIIVDITKIPIGMSIEEFIDFIQENNIVLKQ